MEPTKVNYFNFYNNPENYIENDKCYFMRIYRLGTTKYIGKFMSITQKKVTQTVERPSKIVFEHYTVDLDGGHGGGPDETIYELPGCLSKAEGDAALPGIIKAMDTPKAPPPRTIDEIKALIKAEVSRHKLFMERLEEELSRATNGGSRNKKVYRSRKTRSKRRS